MSTLYEVLDPRPIAAEAPYTFFLPNDVSLRALCIGDHVKATLRAIPPSRTYDAERVWVTVSAIEAGCFVGHLASVPADMPLLPQGSLVRVPRTHVIDVSINDPARAAELGARGEHRREYWQRCLVDRAVLDGEVGVEYLYREAPTLAKAGDKFPDSGWRIRGDTRAGLSAQSGDRKPSYVALGLVLNKDDSWLHLIDEPVGAKFEKDYANGSFRRL